jgi:glycosyltransferase involved in cell wall biosynthesis
MRRWPRSSPYENTRNIFLGLSRRLPTVLYALDEQVRCDFSPGDVFLGHPRFPFGEGKMGVTELSLRGTPRPRIFALISPLHCDASVRTTHINKAYLDAVDSLLPRADILFGIMGEYWWDQWPNSPYAHWMDKMVRLDMAVDTTCFPRVKRTFNPPGRRGFLYIGRNDPMKGIDFLSQLARHTRDCRWGWIGSGPPIEGIPCLSGPRPLTPDYLSRLAGEFDFFVNASVADPNPTTILESMAWGFPVICTPQSGYYETSYRRNMCHADLEGSIGVLRQLQSLEEAKLQGMADEARRVVEERYTWDRLTDCLCNRLGLTLPQCGRKRSPDP